MTKFLSIVAARKQSPQAPYRGSAPQHATAPSQVKRPDPAAHEARPVLHLPVRMRGVYRHAASLKGA